ncbi:MAG: hypothetical protein ACI909_002661 [Planctomycetota bacterium]|jgi:hypothetical protein
MNNILKYSGMLAAGLAFSLNVFADTTSSGNDNTGTDPLNFSKDFRVYNEFSWLNTSGDGSQNMTTFEYRTPILDGKWQWRVRARANSLSADFNNDGLDDVDDSGIGDVDMRFLTILSFDSASKTAWAGGVELSLDTASEDSLGSGATSIGPQLFYVKFLETGLFAPGIQYKFSVDESEGRKPVEQVLVDLNYLKMSKDKKSWFFTDPQIVFDQEHDIEFAIVDLEWGWMMANWIPDLKGHSFYVRPSIGVGVDRPTDGSIEFGYKIVGW